MCRDEKSEVHAVAEHFYFATQLLGVFERESFVCRAGSLALHLLVLVFCLGVQCTPS